MSHSFPFLEFFIGKRGSASSDVTSRYSGRRVEGMGEVWKASLIDDLLRSTEMPYEEEEAGSSSELRSGLLTSIMYPA
ncbi:Uncharacterised protein [uncultured archaeon]|nr:Uncharacterised protein [uncultured archaeon]